MCDCEAEKRNWAQTSITKRALILLIFSIYVLWLQHMLIYAGAYIQCL